MRAGRAVELDYPCELRPDEPFMQTINDLYSAYGMYLPWLGSVSAVTFLISLALVPTLLAKIPQNYFAKSTNPSPKISGVHYPLVWLLRNLAGLLLILAGVAMLVLPGQGLLTIFLGIFVAEFPGKHVLERKLVSNKKVFQAINWIRARKGVAALAYPE